MTEVFLSNTLLLGSYKFCKVFSSMALHDLMKGGTSMDISPGRARTQQPEQVSAHQHASFSSTARDLLGKKVSEEVCFWL